MTNRFLVLSLAFIMMLSLVACGGGANDILLSDYKNAAKNDLIEYGATKNESDYASDDWVTLQLHIDSGLTAIDNAANQTEVNSAYLAAMQAIDDIQTSVRISSIHYLASNGFKGWEHHAYYDFLEMTYSIKNVDIYNEAQNEVKKFVVVSTFTAQQVEDFFENFDQLDLYSLDEYYYPSDTVFDGDGWELTIIFSNGESLLSDGYMEYPPQKDDIDSAFMILTGYSLFDSEQFT